MTVPLHGEGCVALGEMLAAGLPLDLALELLESSAQAHHDRQAGWRDDANREEREQVALMLAGFDMAGWVYTGGGMWRLEEVAG